MNIVRVSDRIGEVGYYSELESFSFGSKSSAAQVSLIPHPSGTRLVSLGPVTRRRTVRICKAWPNTDAIGSYISETPTKLRAACGAETASHLVYSYQTG